MTISAICPVYGELAGPCYLRLGKGGKPIIDQTEPAFAIGKVIVVRAGKDVTLISTDDILSNVVSASEQLASQIQAWVLSMPTAKPLDKDALLRVVVETRTSMIVTVEEHSMVERQTYLLNKLGLSPAGIALAVEQLLIGSLS